MRPYQTMKNKKPPQEATPPHGDKLREVRPPEQNESQESGANRPNEDIETGRTSNRTSEEGI